MTELRKLYGTQLNVVMVGHSLGGALVVLNSIALAQRGELVDVVSGYTAACPMVLDRDAQASLQAMRRRIKPTAAELHRTAHLGATIVPSNEKAVLHYVHLCHPEVRPG